MPATTSRYLISLSLPSIVVVVCCCRTVAMLLLQSHRYRIVIAAANELLECTAVTGLHALPLLLGYTYCRCCKGV
ncbi:hypothetical protein D8674_033779 [Pyrus ussuriensis x Pyrus communis]|uniref:Uncharacterized protein n=1 Tax=Pyrus ussuriensis x Pyrus communis TaxID=2448454 RepID=A0A5N5I014_9ROSA|nr:hypothetical protein D8674_033779 [Pyrus ussuriensis x Pyrus communis]